MRVGCDHGHLPELAGNLRQLADPVGADPVVIGDQYLFAHPILLCISGTNHQYYNTRKKSFFNILPGIISMMQQFTGLHIADPVKNMWRRNVRSSR